MIIEMISTYLSIIHKKKGVAEELEVDSSL